MNKRRNLVAALAMVVVAIGVTAGAAAMVLSSSPIPDSPAVEAIKANVSAGLEPWNDIEGILYVERSAGPENQPSEETFWIDVSSQRSRIVGKIDGEVFTDTRTTPKKFLAIDVDMGRASTRDVENSDGWHLTHGLDSLWIYERFLQDGSA